MTHTRSHKLFATVALTVLSWTSTLLLTTPATAETPTEAEIAPLIEQLKVADEFTRGDRVAALAKVGAPAVPALIKALESDNFLIRQGAGEALSKIGDPAVPDLLKSLESNSPRLRAIAATVLGNISKSNLDSVAPALLQLLLQDADPRVRRHAFTSLSQRWNFASPFYEGVLFKLLKEYLPKLKAALKNDPEAYVRSSAAWALGSIGADAKAVVPDLVNALKNDPEVSVRFHAAKALGRIGADAKAAVPDLVNALKNDPEADVRSTTAEALVRIGEAKEVVPELVKALKNDPDSFVRRDVAWTLGQIGTDAKAAVPDLLKALQDDPEAYVQSTAGLALQWIGADAAAVPDLVKALQHDPEADVRRSAADVLRAIGSDAKAAVPELITALQHDPEADVRSTVAEALESIGADAKAAVPDLLKALQHDPEAEVRKSAASALLSISLSLQEQAKTLSPAKLDQVISDLSAALKIIESDKVDLSSNQIATLRLSLNALQAQKNAHFSNWIRQNKVLAGGLFYLVFFPSLWSILFWLRPLWLVPINDALKHNEFKLPDSLGGVPVNFRVLTFLSLFSDRPRVMDAWVSAHISTVREEFKTLETVQERRTYISIPVILDGNTLPDLTSESLRPLFDRQRACLLIVGEGGSGKTSIACQIALWAIQETPQHRLAPHLTIPILIEEELTPRLTATPHPLRETIRRQLQDLTGKAEPISDELLANLLKHRRILVILDHISEMSEATRQQIQLESVDINALVITSRLEEPLNRTTQCCIKPLRIAGNRLSSFMEAYLTQRGKQGLFSTDKEFFNACIQLSEMVGKRDITGLLAKLYAEQLIWAKEGYQSADLPENIPDLMLSYLNELNRDVTEDKLADRTLHQDAKAIAWECLKERYRPASAHIKDAIAALPAPDADQRLHYLESKLRLLQTVGVAKENLRFALDPVAEYLAGLHLVDLYKTDSQQWQDFFKTADAQSGAPDAIKGFLLAVRDCYLAKIPGAKDSDFVPKEIGDRTMTQSAPPQAVAQPVSP